VALLDQMALHGYGELHLARDPATGLRAYVAIHDTRLGPSLGGCRFITYGSEEQAAVDALRLARGMTSKAALAGLSLGGGKAVIWREDGTETRLAPGSAARRDLFRAFGRVVDGLSGRYITAEDSGTSPEDMVEISKSTKHVVGLPESLGGVGDPSPYTARGVRRGIEAVAREVLGRDSLQGVHVAIQGIGHVGLSLARELAQAGCQLTVADISFSRIRQAQQEVGSDVGVADIDEILETECDVLAPCALGGVIRADTVGRLRCRAVAGAANNQLADSTIDEALFRRGIFWAPDYAINAAGLIWVAQAACGLSRAEAVKKIDGIYDTIASMSRRSRSEKTPPGALSDRMVEERLAQAARV